MRGWASLGLALAFVGAACAPPAGEPPNLLLITVDTLRADRIGAYGYPRAQTPHIDALAASGALFENAVTDTPWTTPSMSSVMTGTYPTDHGFKSTNVDRLAPENETLAERLKAAGYTTAAIVGSFPLDSVYQLDQGFDTYDDRFTTAIWTMPGHEFEPIESRFFESPDDQRFFTLSKALNDSRREDSEVSDAALAWLDAAPEEPFFLWVHYFGPHEKPDWRVAEERRERRRIAMYDPDTHEVDRQIGRLLAGLERHGLDGETFVVFHADHGESLGEQGLVGHGQLLNRATMDVPLILRWPGRIAAGQRVEGLARNVDILPTLLDAAGLPIPEDLDGTSLLRRVGSLRSRASGFLQSLLGQEPVAYMETYYPAHVAFATPVTLADGSESKVGVIRRGVQTERWRFVRSDPYPLLDVAPGTLPEVPAPLAAAVQREELFDLEAAGDDRNVIAQHPEVAARLREALARHLADEREREVAPPADVDPETRLRLKSLGYGE